MKEYSAGGVVYRKTGEQTEILLIHDRFGRTTLPKGHVEEGETIKETALREVHEETGIVAKIIGDPLGLIKYQFDIPGKGTITKEVTYYLMQAVRGDTRAQLEEIKEASWYPLENVIRIHSEKGYDNNNIIVERAVTRLGNLEQK